MWRPREATIPMAGRFRRHVPFVAFIAALTAFTLWLQLNIAPYLSSFLALHLFFEVALGATAVAVLRNVIGLKTFGTFAAVIVAAAMVVAGALLGLLIFGMMLAAVLVARAGVAKEAVQESHRVAILVTTVSIAVVGIFLAGLYTNLPGLAYAALFPILITAWVAERFAAQVARIGWSTGLRTLALTLVAILVAYVVMIQTAAVQFVIRNPLSWTGLVVLNWLLGTRVRFRLSERLRFRGARPDDAADDLGDVVLTMNRRNRDYVDRYNPQGLLSTLDKARAKALLVPQGIPMPRTYLFLRGRKDLPGAAALLDRLDTVAIKPAAASGGEGIVLVRGRTPDGRYRVNGHAETRDGLLRHLARIVDGEFNDGTADVAILEELIESDPAMRPLAPEGVPDLRIVTFLGYPVMAMARLPTARSAGRANLHSGAVGAGISLATGRITSATWDGMRVDVHPDTGVALPGFKIPHWREVLEIAAAAQEASGLGFAGVDVVLDARRGPVMMEINRRPGLEVQNANRAGLLPRLRIVEGLPHAPGLPERRVEVAIRWDEREWGAVPTAVQTPASNLPANVASPANGR